MGLNAKVTELITKPLANIGIDVVNINLRNAPEGKYLEIIIERLDTLNVGFDDCTKASKLVSKILDIEDIITTKYFLSISSPGINRGLFKIGDFERFKSKPAEIFLHKPIITEHIDLNDITPSDLTLKNKRNLHINKQPNDSTKKNLKKIQCVLKGADDKEGKIHVLFEENVISIDFSNVKKANLVLEKKIPLKNHHTNKINKRKNKKQ